MKTRHHHIVPSVAVGAVAALALLLCSANVARADDITVCPPGAGVCDYDSVQAAVDAANEGDVIKVAAGVYTGTQQRPSPPGYPGPGLIRQVVYVSKTLTIQGGYTVTNWLEPQPEVNVTTLDAQGDGRVMVVAGEISPTIAGLRMTGGDASGLGGCILEFDAGGGVYVLDAPATIRQNWLFANKSSHNGGGMFFYRSNAWVDSNTISANTADDGAGLYLYQSDATIRDNSIFLNIASNNGGGVYLALGDVCLERNTVNLNTANNIGGGLVLRSGRVRVEYNVFSQNVAANYGGGLSLGIPPG